MKMVIMESSDVTSVAMKYCSASCLMEYRQRLGNSLTDDRSNYMIDGLLGDWSKGFWGEPGCFSSHESSDLPCLSCEI